MDEPLIVQTIHRYHPGWVPPKDTGRTWLKTNCPFHQDETASAAVSYEHNAFGCLSCSAKGNEVTLIMNREGVSYSTAKRLAQEVSPGSSRAVSPKPERQSRRRVFGDSEAGVPEPDTGARSPVPTRIRRRSPPWA